MARTVIAPQTTDGPYPVLPYGGSAANLAWTGNTDPTDRYVVLVEGKTFILARNTDTVSHDITIVSVADAFNRTGDITYTVAAGAVAKLGPFKAAGWGHSSQIWIDVTDAKLEVAVLTLP